MGDDGNDGDGSDGGRGDFDCNDEADDADDDDMILNTFHVLQVLGEVSDVLALDFETKYDHCKYTQIQRLQNIRCTFLAVR